MSGANQSGTASGANQSGTASDEPSAWAPPDATTKRLAPALIGARVRPRVSATEAAIIAAAMEALWPKPVVVVAVPPARQEAWRFSGRWWARPISARRPRPWY